MRSNEATAIGKRRLRIAIVPLALVVFAACAVGATASGRQAAAGPVYKVVGTIGKEGTGNGQFSTNVTGLATDNAGNVYVSDGNLNRIQAFSAKGAYLRKYAMVAGEGATADVAVGPTGDVWGTTQTGAQARRFPKAGGAPETLSTPKSADGIAVDADGNVYVSTSGDNVAAVVRFDKTDTGWAPAKTWVGGGFQWPIDVEASPDGTIYVADVKGAPPNVKHYDAKGKLLKKINMNMPATAGAGVTLGIGVDPDCNVWTTNNGQRNVILYSPSGKVLATATSGDMLAKDVAVGPTGDLYVFDVYAKKVVRFGLDRSKPAAANVGRVSVAKKGAGYVARVKYTLSGVACPAQVSATASLAGKGVTGKAVVKVGAGKSTLIEIPLAKGPLASVSGSKASATFKIVLRTNGRATTQSSTVSFSVPK
jgi:sugar lactone lactonase YvrE